MTAPTSCPGCGAKIAPNDRFCGVCGADLTAAPKPPPSSAAKPAANLHKTMLGISPSQVAAPPATQAPAARPAAPGPAPMAKAVPQRTMLGMSVPLVGAPVPTQAAGELKPPAAAPETSPRPGAVGPAPKQTLLGITPAMSASLAAGKAAQQAPDPAKQTRFGVGEPIASPQASAPTPDRAAAKLPAQSARTVLGITPPVAASAGRTPGERAPSADRVDPFDARQGQARQRSFTPVSTPASMADDDFGAAAPLPSSGAQRFLWLAVGALTVLAVGGGLLAWLSARGPELSVRVVNLDGIETLEVEAPGSSPKSKLRFMGVEQPLEAGRARFPLKPDTLTIGDNPLSIDLISESGEVESSSVQLAVAYRVRVDTAALQSTPPAIDVVVDALPGSQVIVDAVPLALNERGHGARRYPVVPQAGGVFAFSASYRVEAPGEEPADGKLELTLPVTSMQIDTPGAEVVTDQAVLEVAGQVEPGAAVEVAGQPVQVLDGRFLQRAELGEVGDHVLKVIARAKGKAPRVAEIKVNRVQDLVVAAASFVPDPSLTYARIAQKPVIYRGQKVAFDGRVYHAEVDAGRSVLQMLVLDCPGQSRCPLWVEYPQATHVDLDSWVRVLGVVAGEQQFRSKQGQVHTVPSVHAQYVLKLAK